MVFKVLGIVEIVVGAIGILFGFVMYGDIGIACLVGALGNLLSGIAFLSVGRAFKTIKKEE